jgi:hypothetical protein
MRVRLFQIEEPEGGPADPGAPGAAIGLDASGAEVEVGFSVGGNAIVLEDREGFERVLPVPATAAGAGEWRATFEAARARAERALSRPVTHVVVLLARQPDGDEEGRLREAAELAGLSVLRLVATEGGPNDAVAAALLAEELAPRPDFGT